MKAIFALLTLLLVAGTANAEINIIEKKTIGIEPGKECDFKVRFFTVCIDGHMFVKSFAYCPLTGVIDSDLVQIYEEGEGNKTAVPAKCKKGVSR